MEANMFVIAMKPTLENRLGKETAQTVLADASAWYALVEKGDLKAEKTGDQITDALEPLN
ncbi:hypothetical protein [Exiguobacterium artemiae]